MIIQDLLQDVPVARLMRSEMAVVPLETSIEDFIQGWAMRYDEQTFPVVESDRLVGLVSVEDVRKINKENWPITPVTRIMTPANELSTVDPNEDSAEALARLTRKGVKQLPVIKDGHLIGILRKRDVLRWLKIHSDVTAA
jgi:CBS domain-containing protein